MVSNLLDDTRDRRDKVAIKVERAVSSHVPDIACDDIPRSHYLRPSPLPNVHRCTSTHGRITVVVKVHHFSHSKHRPPQPVPQLGTLSVDSRKIKLMQYSLLLARGQANATQCS